MLLFYLTLSFFVLFSCSACSCSFCLLHLLLLCFTVLLLLCFTVALLLCFTVALFTVLLLLCFTVALFYCFTVALFYCLTVALLLCFTVALFYCCSVLLSCVSDVSHQSLRANPVTIYISLNVCKRVSAPHIGKPNTSVCRGQLGCSVWDHFLTIALYIKSEDYSCKPNQTSNTGCICLKLHLN